MMKIIQIVVGLFISVATLVLLFLMAMSEINFKDITFALYFALFSLLASIAFFVITRREDNEETNPAREKLKK